MFHFLAGHHRHGGRCVENAGRHLAANPEFLGDHRVDIVVGTHLDLGVYDQRCEAVVLGVARAEVQRGGRRYQLVGIGALLFGLQLAALQQRRQCGRGFECAVHALGRAVLYACSIEGKTDASFTREAVKRRCQWACRDVPLLDLIAGGSSRRCSQRRQRVAADDQTQHRYL
ncbi:hypothetical protein D3C73_1262710 [compost metagenome]